MSNVSFDVKRPIVLIHLTIICKYQTRNAKRQFLCQTSNCTYKHLTVIWKYQTRNVKRKFLCQTPNCTDYHLTII